MLCKLEGCTKPAVTNQVYCSREHSPFGMLAGGPDTFGVTERTFSKPKVRPFNRGPVKNVSESEDLKKKVRGHFRGHLNTLMAVRRFVGDHDKLGDVSDGEIKQMLHQLENIDEYLRSYMEVYRAPN